MPTITVNRDGENIDITYDKVLVDLSGSESAQIKGTWIDNLGRTQTERFNLTFPGAAADTVRSQIETGVSARIKSEYDR